MKRKYPLFQRIITSVVFLGVLACCLTFPGCKADEEELETVDEILATLLEANDSLILWWSLSMDYEDAAEKTVEWLFEQDNVDTCWLWASNAIGIEFIELGAEIIPPQGCAKPVTSEPVLDTTSPEAFLLSPYALFLQPFEWEFTDQAYKEMRTLLKKMDGADTATIEYYKNDEVTVEVLKTEFTNTYGIIYVSSHGTVIKDDLYVLVTGEEATKELITGDYKEDIDAGRVRVGVCGDKVYFDITPAFVTHYWIEITPIPRFGTVVHFATCNSAHSSISNAFLSKAGVQAFLGFPGDLYQYQEISHLLIYNAMATEPIGLVEVFGSDTTKWFGLKLWVIPEGSEFIFDRVLCELDGVSLHSDAFVVAGRIMGEGGLSMSAAVYDEACSQKGTITVATDQYAVGDYTETLAYASPEGKMFIYDPDFAELSSQISLSVVDEPKNLVRGTFSGVLGWWDPNDPNFPRPPDEKVTITNGQFHAVLKD